MTFIVTATVTVSSEPATLEGDHPGGTTIFTISDAQIGLHGEEAIQIKRLEVGEVLCRGSLATAALAQLHAGDRVIVTGFLRVRRPVDAHSDSSRALVEIEATNIAACLDTAATGSGASAVRRSGPTWLTEECPSWCNGEHEEDDHPGDHCHHSEATYLAAVVAEEDSVPITATLTGMDLTVRRGRYVGDPAEWVAIEPALDRREPRLVLTADSAARLTVALQLQLNDVITEAPQPDKPA